MDEHSQPDAPEELPTPTTPTKKDRTRNQRKARWRKANPKKASAQTAAWRAKHPDAYRDYQRRYMAAYRLAKASKME